MKGLLLVRSIVASTRSNLIFTHGQRFISQQKKVLRFELPKNTKINQTENDGNISTTNIDNINTTQNINDPPPSNQTSAAQSSESKTVYSAHYDDIGGGGGGDRSLSHSSTSSRFKTYGKYQGLVEMSDNLIQFTSSGYNSIVNVNVNNTNTSSQSKSRLQSTLTSTIENYDNYHEQLMGRLKNLQTKIVDTTKEYNTQVNELGIKINDLENMKQELLEENESIKHNKDELNFNLIEKTNRLDYVSKDLNKIRENETNMIAKNKLLELKIMELNEKITKLENELGIKENDKIELNNKIIDNKVKMERLDYELTSLRGKIIISDNENKELMNQLLQFKNERHRARQAFFGISGMFLFAFLFVKMNNNNNINGNNGSEMVDAENSDVISLPMVRAMMAPPLTIDEQVEIEHEAMKTMGMNSNGNKLIDDASTPRAGATAAAGTEEGNNDGMGKLGVASGVTALLGYTVYNVYANMR